MDDGAIARRRAEVFAGVEDKAHEVSKHKEMDMFGVFLETRPTESLRRTSVFDASPADVVDFLVQRDLAGTGHTIVHERTCIVGEADQGTKCDCPKRLSNSAVHAMASKLKTRFAELGGGGNGVTCLSQVTQRTRLWYESTQRRSRKNKEGRAACR